MKNDTAQERFAEAFRDLREYGTLQWEALRLKGVESLSLFLNAAAAGFVMVMLGSIALFFIGALVTLLLAELTGSWLLAVGIMAAVFTLALVIVALKRKTLFVNPLVRLLARMLFETREKE